MVGRSGNGTETEHLTQGHIFACKVMPTSFNYFILLIVLLLFITILIKALLRLLLEANNTN